MIELILATNVTMQLSIHVIKWILPTDKGWSDVTLTDGQTFTSRESPATIRDRVNKVLVAR